MNIKTKRIVTAAVVGALYAALTLALAPISYGPLQFRVSEVLCILPYFLPYTARGSTRVKSSVHSPCTPDRWLWASLASCSSSACRS